MKKIGFKIREHTIQRIPYLLVVGDNEVESGLSLCVPVVVKTWDLADLEAFTTLLTRDVERRGRISLENQY